MKSKSTFTSFTTKQPQPLVCANAKACAQWPDSEKEVRVRKKDISHLVQRKHFVVTAFFFDAQMHTVSHSMMALMNRIFPWIKWRKHHSATVLRTWLLHWTRYTLYTWQYAADRWHNGFYVRDIHDKICILPLLLKKSIFIFNFLLFRRRRQCDYRISLLFSFQTATRILLQLAYWPN